MSDQHYTRLPIRPSNNDLFRGRADSIRRLLKHLPKPGVSAVIYGERGIGKTSLALQIMSALEGGISKYQKHFWPKPGGTIYKCISVKGLSAPTNRNDLLISAVSHSMQDRSFAAAAPKLYEDKNFLDSIAKSYGPHLRDAQAMSIFGKLADNADVVDKLFEDVTAHARKLYPDTEFVFFVDEVDRMQDSSGLGELVKNANSSRFVFVGIADTLEEIMRDHESAFRRITRGIEGLEPMRPKEVRSLFREPLSAYSPRISSHLVEGVVKYSGGIPWLIHVAGEAIIEQIEAGPASAELTFKKIWTQTENEWKASFGQRADFKVLERDMNRKVLSTFIISGKYLKDEEVGKLLSQMNINPALTTVRACLSDLESAGILRRRGATGSYRFADPIIRAFSFERIESLNGSALEIQE